MISGQSEALNIYTVHRNELVGYAKKILDDEAHAEDVVQEAYFRFVQAAEKTILSEPLAYLYRIVRNLCYDLQRQLKRDQHRKGNSADLALEQLAELRPSAEREIIAKQELEYLSRLLGELTDKQRIAFEMHRFGNHTFKEIALHLDVSIGTAHQLVVQAIEYCSDKL
ncbi:RNA polymerase sigma factor, partial [Curvivirga aplysinae]|uniref:RNA polymerase sigma factor n=1 Tax=Curvivirga aplysinae TaxID=2529852 RepID=UPI0012BC8C45